MGFRSTASSRIALGLLWLLVGDGLLGLPISDLESQLEAVHGADRLSVLVELTHGLRRKDPPRAMVYGTEGLALLGGSTDPDLARELHISLCYAQSRLRASDTQPDLCDRALELLQGDAHVGDRALVLRLLGDTHRQLSAYQLAAVRSREAATLYRRLGKTSRTAASWNEVGIAHRSNDEYPEALGAYLEAFRLYGEAGDDLGIARVLNNMGIVYREIGSYDEALDAYTRALEIQRTQGKPGAVGRLLNNIGALHRFSGKPEEALEAFHGSYAIKNRLGDRKGMAITLGNIGLALADLGQLSEAEDHQQRSLRIKDSLGDLAGMPNTLLNLANVQRMRGKTLAAIDNLQEGSRIAESLGRRDDLQNLYAALAEAYESQEEIDLAFRALQESRRLEQELLDEDTRRRLLELQTLHRLETKEQDIRVLQQAQAIAALETRQKTLQSRALWVVLALLTCLTAVLINHLRLRARSARVIADKNRALEDTLSELEHQREEMKHFTYAVSHDLKAPLLTVRSFLGYALQDLEKGKLDRLGSDLTRASDSANSMTQLLEELLESSRLGRVRSESTVVPLRELVDEAIGRVAGRLSARGVEVHIAHDLPEVFGDRKRLVEVLQNLLDNAAKFMGEQEYPWVEVGAEPLDPDIEAVTFFVRDNGMGIPPEVQGQIFGLFDRHDTSVEGTGIGLAMVARIIEAHGGSLRVESTGPGQGATFFVTLPSSGSNPEGGP